MSYKKVFVKSAMQFTVGFFFNLYFMYEISLYGLIILNKTHIQKQLQKYFLKNLEINGIVHNVLNIKI